MFKFFRKFRQKLIVENRFSKYLLYAIGEIILVVIGILIALSINNWNQRRLDKQKSQEFLQRISNDLQGIVEVTRFDINKAKEITEYISKSVVIMRKGELSVSGKDTLDYTFNTFFQYAQITDELDSFEELKSTGQLGLIYNKELREDINVYLRELKKISEIYDQASSTVNNTQLFDKYITILEYEKRRDNLDYNFQEIAKNQALINTLSRYGYLWRSKQYFSENLNRYSMELNDKIIKELKGN